MKKFGNPDRKARSSFLVAGIYYVVSLCSAVLVMQACSSMPSAPKADRFIESVYAKLEHGDLDGALALFNGLSPEDAAKSRNLLF
ncbi:MAG: hypothetical protein LBD22_05725, partial [Spirochaetaceae bacterium]|nr:hypothetical protein [Spirochaetaceae bacterium]